MGLISHVLAFGLGYALGRPDGPKRLVQLGKQAGELTRHPEAKRLRERGWDLAGDQFLAARRMIDRSRRADAGDRSGAQPSTDQPDGGWRARARARRRPHPADSAPASTDAAAPPAGFSGATVAEDSHAVRMGLSAPPPPTPAVPPAPPRDTS